MRNTVTIISFIIVVLAIIAAIYYGAPTHDTKPSGEVPIEQEFDTKVVYTTNMDADTAPLKADCDARGGTFNECGSICAPDAQMCAQVCAYTCDNISGDGTNKGADIPDSWQTYENEAMGFSLKYPPDDFITVTPSEIPDQGPSVQFEHWGPTQERNTEFYDGISITVTRIPYERSVKAKAEEEFNSATPVADRIIEPVHPITLGGVEGYAYRVQSVTRYTSAYVPVSDTHLLRVSWVVEDPTNQGFADIAEKMRASFSVL